MKMLLLSAFFAVTSLFAQETLPAELFKQQLQRSCEANMHITKSVQDLNEPEAAPQTKSILASAGDACVLQDELVHAFLIYHGEKRLQEFFQVVQKGDTLVASLLPEKVKSGALLYQKILLSKDGKTLLYVESKILREYWLYTTSSHIKLHFDAQGLYQSHELETRTDVAIIGDGVNVRILGKREVK